MNPTWINKTEHKNGNDYLPSKSGEGGKKYRKHSKEERRWENLRKEVGKLQNNQVK